MDSACGTYRRQERCLQGFFLVGDLREGDHLEVLGVGERVLLKQMFQTWHGGMDRLDVARDRDSWRAVLNAEMNPGVAENSGNFLIN